MGQSFKEEVMFSYKLLQVEKKMNEQTPDNNFQAHNSWQTKVVFCDQCRLHAVAVGLIT